MDTATRYSVTTIADIERVVNSPPDRLLTAKTMPEQKCVLCDSKCEAHHHGTRDIYVVKCPVCGQYLITDGALGALGDQKIASKRYVLAGVARNASDNGKPVELLSDNLAGLIDAAPLPRSPLDSVSTLLLRIAEDMPDLTQGAAIPFVDFAKYYLRSSEDFRGVLGLANQLGYVADWGEENGYWDVRLNAEGWERVGQLRERIPSSRQAFVAMSFADELKPAYVDGINPALKETGYQPLRIDEVHHNEKIDDRIVAELRRSGLVIADFTGHRGGVYFETGYALGRGIPVIWCCRADEVDKAHFDTRQFNHLTWKTPEELRERLRDRIQATLATYPPIA